MDKIEINNSYEAAVKSGKWGNPGASFYDKIKHSKALLNEAYLEVGDVDKDTSFSASECKFPHHCIVNGELVVSIPGIKAAYSRAKQMGKFSGEIKKHLEKHYKAMGIYKDSNMYKESVMEDRFQSIYNVLGINPDEFMKEGVIQESAVKEYDMFEDYFIPRGITTPEKLLEFMNGIEYDDDDEHWKLRDPYKDNRKYGNCHDQSLFEKIWFEKFGYECGQIFFIEYREGEDKGGRTHTLTWFKDNDKYYWFENAWYDNKGIHGPFDSLKELKDFVHSKWEETNNTFPEDKKYTDIEFFDTPNYLIGMDLAQYVDSWTGNYNEQVAWISRFVNDQEFRESIFSEASHGKLTKDFRFGWDYTTGHMIKVIYDIKNIEITDIGDFYYNYDGKKVGATKDSHLDYVKKNIAKKGNVDHQSKGQKVLAIVDMVTNKNLDSVTLLNPYCHYIDTHATSQSQENLEKARKYADEENPKCKVELRKGEIDNIPSFKSTWFSKTINDLTDPENLRFRQLATAEQFKNGRGWKLNNITPRMAHITGVDGQFTTFKNPNKEQALRELIMREKDSRNYINRIKQDVYDNPELLKDRSTKQAYEAELNNLRIIQNDIKIIQSGKYSLDMMKKYRDSKTGQLAGLENAQLIEYNTYMDSRHPDVFTEELSNDNAIIGISTHGNIYESLEVLNSIIWNESADDPTLMNLFTQVGLPAHTAEILESMKVYSNRVNDTDEYVFCIECDKYLPFIESIICDEIDSKILKFNELFESYKNHEILPNIILPIEYAKECHSNIFRSNSDEMKVVVLDEKSHGWLKFSFRMGINKENGHLIKVVFDLKKDDIVRFGSHDDTNHIPRDKWPELKKNINKTGHGDFTSLATVKAIIDMDTNEHLQAVKMVGIMNGNQNFARKTLKEREQIMANGGRFYGGNKFTVGEKETFGDWDSWKGTYKTTTPANSVDHLQKIVNPHLHKESANIIEDSDIEDKWFIKSDDGVDNCCIKVKGYDKPMRGRSSMIVLGFIPSKEAGINVLGILGKKNSNDYGVPGGGWNKDEDPKDAAIRELHEETLEDVKDVHRMGTLIEYHKDVAKWVKDHVNDEKDWWYGYYSAIFVGKYNGKFHGHVDEKDRESGCKWYEVNDIWEKLPKEYRQAISDYLNTYSLPENIQESVDLLDIEVPIEEASHSNLKYCYRVGFDTDTGEQVAVEFELDPEKVTEPKTKKKDDILTNQMGASHKIIGSDASLKKIQNKISAFTELIKDNIKKKGCIDFVTKDLKVHAIFTRSGRSLDHVHMLPLVNGKVKELIGVLMAKTNFDIKKDFDSQIDKILDSEKFKEGISLLANSSEMYSVSEDYVVGKPGGADKYKSTKLIWKNGLLSSYGFTPILRGFIKDKGSPLLNQDGSRNTNPEKIKKLAKLYIQKNGFVRPKDFKEYVLESVDIIKHKDVNKGGLGVDTTKMESHLDCINENMELYDILSVLYNESLECINFIWNNPNISWFYCWIPQGFYEKINMVDNLINIIESDSDCIIIDESTDSDLTEINDLFTEADDDKIDVTSAIENNIKSSEDSKEEPQKSEEEQQPEETPVEEPQSEEETKEKPIEAPPEIEEPVEEPKEEIKEEPPKEETPEEAPKEPTSLPKQTDKAEASKNGVNRKKLYIAFIEYCKGINPKNVLSSVFDKDVFHITYPFVPDEMRYFYRLANPTVCILQDNMAFFELSELKKINSDNPEFPKKLVFAGTPEMVYIFDTDDKKVYTATEGKDKLTIKEKVGDSFDLFIQDMVGQGDILNAPPEIKEVVADA